MPEPTGEGIPQRGDRSARNTHAYADLHASDIEEEEYTYHNPWPMADGEAAVSDGDKLVPTDIATQAELDAHAAAADAHHAPVTLSAEAADVLALLDQEIDLEAQAANTVLAGPASGADAKPTFRSLVAADLGTGTPDGTKFLRDDLTWQFAATDGGGGGSGAPAGYAETIGDGVNTEYTVTHNLGTWDVLVQVYDLGVTPREKVDPEIEATSADAVVVTFETAPSADQYRVLVVAADVGTVGDAADLAYTPATPADWDGDVDPGDTDDALDQLAERVTDLETAPAPPADLDDLADVNASAPDDGDVLTWDAAAEEWVPEAPSGGGGGSDAADVTYTPATPSDWDGSADPGNADDAFDQLAERVADLEDIPGGTDANAIHDNVAGEIHAIAEKASPVSADEIVIEDSADTYAKKRVQIGNLPSGGGGLAGTWYGLAFDGTDATEEATEATATTGSSYDAWADVDVYVPLLVKSWFWSIAQNDTYTITINGAVHSTVVVSTAPVNDVEFAFATPIILTPGRYRVYLTGTAARQQRYRSGSYTGTRFATAGMTFGANYQAPIGIKAEEGEWGEIS